MRIGMMFARRGAAFALASCLSLSCALSAQAEGMIGMKLADAKKKDIFNFFHFKEMGRDKNSAGTLVEYGTKCMGHAAVMVVEVSGADETIEAANLTLPRSFVEGDTVCVFARDIAKSFLSQAIPESDFESYKTLIAEIEFGGQSRPIKKGDTTLTVVQGAKTNSGKFIQFDGNSAPKLPDTPTPGYNTYLGNQKTFEGVFAHSKLNIINNPSKNGVLLNILVRPNHKATK